MSYIELPNLPPQPKLPGTQTGEAEDLPKLIESW